MRVLVLQHIACEHPGAFSEVLDERGVEAVPVELDEGEALPDWREFDAVLAMGGPMGAADDSEHPWLAPERELVREAVGDGRAFLGVCLGVQLLAASLGGEIRPSEPPEVGLLPVELTDEGRRDPLFAGLDDTLVSLQWHGDTFELPGGSVRLARSELVPNQAFRFGERAYGVQFHLEVTAEMAREWANVPAYRQSLAENLGEERGAAFLREVEQRAAELHPPARRLFENWLDLAATA
jgi:GMP synthase-like glutamine amidotransferase